MIPPANPPMNPLQRHAVVGDGYTIDGVPGYDMMTAANLLAARVNALPENERSEALRDLSKVGFEPSEWQTFPPQPKDPQ